MADLRKLQARKQSLAAMMRKVVDVAENEERLLTEDEQASYDECKADLEQINAIINREMDLRELERGLIPDEPEPAIDPNQNRANQQEWGSLGEFLQAVARAGTGGGLDQRLVRPAAITGLGESVGSEGGFLVQTDFVSTLLRRTYDNSQLLRGGAGYSGATRIPLGGNSNGVKINATNESSRATGSRWGGIQAYWKEEGGTPTATKPDFRQIELQLKKLMGLCYATDELLADATALESIITTAFSEEFAFLIQDAIVNGTGAGQPLGILNCTALVSVAKESAQAATTIVKANIDKMYARMWARGIPRSVWLINQDCWPQLFALADAGSNAVYLPPGGQMSSAPFGALLGRPVLPIEQCQTLGTKGDIYFVDLSEYLWIDKGTMESATSLHVKFTTDEMTFRFIYRCDGQPSWNVALTPYKGSNTQSPFISLNTRS